MKTIATGILTTVFLVVASIAGAVSVTMLRTAFFEEESIPLASVISLDESGQAVAKEILGERITVNRGSLYLVPQRKIREIVKQHTGDPVVVTGGRTIAIPASMSENEKSFYISMLSFLDDASIYKNGFSEIKVEDSEVRLPDTTRSPLDFELVTKKTKMGYLSGSVTIGFGTRDDRFKDRIGLRIRTTIPVLETTSSFNPNERLTWRKLRTIETDIGTLNQDAFIVPDEIEKYSAKSNIASGSIVFAKMIEPAFDVKIRDSILVVFHRGNILLSMPGKALESGFLNDTVKVKPADTDGSFRGTVTGEREVTVEFGKN
jgi:flagella basal body P-ring formation protein FlgA